jgi:hypothetical protein
MIATGLAPVRVAAASVAARIETASVGTLAVIHTLGVTPIRLRAGPCGLTVVTSTYGGSVVVIARAPTVLAVRRRHRPILN